MTLSWSRMLYVEFTVSLASAIFLRCHAHAFAYFGGLPRTILYDNLKTAVLDRLPDGSVHWQPHFLDFAAHYGFTPRNVVANARAALLARRYGDGARSPKRAAALPRISGSTRASASSPPSHPSAASSPSARSRPRRAMAAWPTTGSTVA